MHNVFIAFIKATRHKFQFTDANHINAWLMRVTRREIINYYRTLFGRNESGESGPKRTMVPLQGEMDGENVASRLTDNGTEAERMGVVVQLGKVYEYINGLPPRAREALLFPDEPLDALAARLNTTPATVGDYRTKGRKKLREHFN